MSLSTLKKIGFETYIVEKKSLRVAINFKLLVRLKSCGDFF